MGNVSDLINRMSENLPFFFSSFIGRSQELSAVQRLLGQNRLLTLTGPGGAGKTRLALAAAGQMADQFDDGIFLAELASLSEPERVAETVATAVSLREQPGQEWLDSLSQWLRPRRVLLLLDNCEHLLTTCAHLAAALLHACPHLTILATSRAPLGLLAETTWPVPPLSLPQENTPLPDLLAYDAVQLFVERATAVDPAFRLDAETAPDLARLCHQLDGLPLAIELAAARTRFLSIAQISARLETSLDLLAAKDPTLPPRQQTLTAAIDWSYQMLTETEAALLQSLSVFVGDFSLTAVAGLADPATDPDAAADPSAALLDRLSQLVDKSLVVVAARTPEPVYRLLALVRQFAWEKLHAEGKATAVQQRHARYYHRLAQTAEPQMRSRHRAAWQARLEAEYDNLLAALHWFAREQAVVPGGEMVWSLRWFFYFRGTVSEAGRRAETFLALSEAPGQTAVRARLHWCLGATQWVFGNYARSYETLAAGRILAQTAVDRPALATILSLQGLMGILTGQGEDPLALHQQAIQLFQAIGDEWGEALALYWLADSLRLRRDHAAARPYFEQSQQKFRRIGDDWGVSLSRQGLGSAAYRQGEYALARSQLEEALRLRRASHDNWLTAQTLSTLATVLQAQGETAVAVSQFQEADTLYRELGDDYGRLYTLFNLGQLAQQSGNAAQARTCFQDCLTLAEALEHPGRIADCRAALARLEEKETAVSSPPALHITAFGPGEVRRADGKLIASSEWRYARVKELFFYLLDGGPQNKAQIGLDFWPDASPARLRRNLHDTLYQLRQALGQPAWILYENGRYAFNQSLPHQYDVTEFARWLQTPTIDSLTEAVQLYRADFLTDFDSAWCLLRRESLRQQHLQALLQLGALLMADGRFDAAADIYRQAIAHDNLLEPAYRGLMRALINMGDTAQAARQYHLLVQVLADELGIAPAAETAVLWRRIQKK